MKGLMFKKWKLEAIRDSLDYTPWHTRRTASIQRYFPGETLYLKSNYYVKAVDAEAYVKVLAVRHERLHDIDEDEAVLEGAIHWSRTIDPKHPIMLGPKAAPPMNLFRLLWDEVNGEGAWVENPRVWVYILEKQPTEKIRGQLLEAE